MKRLHFKPPRRDDDLSPGTWSAITGALVIAGIGSIALLWRAVLHDGVVDPSRAIAANNAGAPTSSASPSSGGQAPAGSASASASAAPGPDGAPPAEMSWQPPLMGKLRRTSPFNPHRMHPVLHRVMPHEGTDFGARSGTPVYAVLQGTLTWAGFRGPTGNLVLISHAGGIETGYAHLSKFAPGLHVGDSIATHQLIGYVGSTGRSTGPHLHFSAKKDGAFFDPETLIKIPEADRADPSAGDTDMHESADNGAAHPAAPRPRHPADRSAAARPKSAASPRPAPARPPAAGARKK